MEENQNQSIQNINPQGEGSTQDMSTPMPSNPVAAFFLPMTTAQKILFGLVSVFLVTLIALVLYWASRPDYTLLFGNLNPAIAQEIVTELRDENIKYRLEQDGSAILVPRSNVYDLRLRFAAQGTSSSSDITGYELFDSNNLGMTDFMQKVNLQRALEGELARTVSAMDQISYARVHLVIPERSPFADKTIQPSASVYLTLTSKQRLTEQQIIGIQSLVAGAVEGMVNENVTLIDGRGNKISENNASQTETAITNAQMKHQRAVETYLTDKTQTMLDRVLGTGNAIVRITTEHDFEKLSRTSNIIDPESRVIISENSVTGTDEIRESDPLLYDEYVPENLRGQSVDTRVDTKESSNETKNYDLNRTQETFEKPIGEIARISASVLLNYQRVVLKDVEGQDSVIYEPYSQDKIDEITQVVSTALGVQPQRGDVVTITQALFDNSDEKYLEQQQKEFERQQMTNQIVRWTLIIIAFLGSVGVLFFLYRRSIEEVQEEPIFLEQDEEGRMITDGMRPDIEYDDAPPEMDPEIQAALRRKQKMIEKIKEFVMNNPEEAASIIRTWMKQKAVKKDPIIN